VLAPVAMSKLKSIILLTFCFLLPSAVWATEGTYLPACSTEIPYFCADAAYFKRGGRDRVEVYFSVTNRALQFVKDGPVYEASADLSVVLMAGDSQVAGDTQRIRLKASKYSETTSVDTVRTGVMSFPAHSGEFTLTVSLADRDTRVKSSIEAPVRIPELNAFPALSDIRFEEPGTQGRSRVYPNVRRLYTGDFREIPFYFEAYADEEDLPVSVVYRVADFEDVTVYADTVSVTKPGEEHFSRSIPMESISNGVFNLILGIRDEAGQVKPVRAKPFQVRSQFFYWGKDVESAVDILTYVAGGGFIDRFKKADPETRKKLWEEFWREKDPTPDTPRNEFYEEHIRRFEYANRHFGTHQGPGWRTDRGRIYIVYGQPDQVESTTFDVDRDTAEIWVYNRLGRRFVFVDETGFGDYRLVDEY
jgi:GWxTD domain-containing protein